MTTTTANPSIPGSVDRRLPHSDDTTVQSAAAALRLLGDPTRLRLIRALCESELDVTALAARVGATPARISQNLAHLRRAGLVHSHRNGRHVVYRVRDPHLGKLIAEAIRHAKRMTPSRTPHQHRGGAAGS